MRQARWTQDGIEVLDVEPGPLRQGWVRLRVLANGICGSDLHFYRRELPPLEGTVPGHELVGTPLDGPRGLADDLYAVEPLTRCGHCDFCVSGNPQLCGSLRVIGIHENGGMSEFVDVPRYCLHAIVPAVPPLLASMAEPLAVAVRGTHLARLDASSRVLVLGAGSIGLLVGLLCRDRAARVAITARHPQQRNAAARLGLEAVTESELEPWALEYAPDVVIETVGGSADTLAQAVRLCRPAGRVIVLGVFLGDRPLNALLLMLKEIRVIGSNTYGTTRRGPEFRAAVELLARHRAELEPLQTHQFGLASLKGAFDCAADKRSGSIKVTIEPASS